MLEHLTICKNNEVRFQSKIYSNCKVKCKKRNQEDRTGREEKKTKKSQR